MDAVGFQLFVLAWAGMVSVRRHGRQPPRPSQHSLMYKLVVVAQRFKERKWAPNATALILTLRRPLPL